MAWGFDRMIQRWGTRVDVYADDVTTPMALGQIAIFENVRTIDMLGRAQADLFHLYFPSTLLPHVLDTGQLPRNQKTGVYYLVVKPLSIPNESHDFLEVGQMASCLQMPGLATLKHLDPLPTPPERNAMDEPIAPSTLPGLQTRVIPIALENDFEPLLLSGTQMTKTPEGIVTLYVPRGVHVTTSDVIIFDDQTVVRVQQANRYPAQGKIVATQVIAQVMEADPYAA